MTDLADILRFMAVAQILLVLGLFWRDKRHHQSTTAGFLFGASVAGYLLASWPPMEDYPAIFLPLLVLPFIAPVTFWLFSKSLFDDGYRWRQWFGWLLAAVVAAHYLKFAITRQMFLPLPEGFKMLSDWLLHLLSLVFILLGILEALRNQESDLVLSRLKFRTVYIVATAGLMILTVLSEVSLRGEEPPPVLDLLQKASIAVLTSFFCMRLLTFKPGFFPENEQTASLPTTTSDIDYLMLSQLSELMDNQKYWRTEGLTIRQLAEKMEVKEYKLRQTINQGLGYRNFNDYLNGYRVREACAVLSDPAKRDLTVLEIAYDLGYVSLAPFNKAFKETTGMTPTEWRRAKMG